jgi:DNA-binding beta-propeller fold protein YncE
VRLASTAVVLLTGGLMPTVAAAQANCNAPAPQAVVHVEIPGNPFEPVATADGCWIFVTMARGGPTGQGGVAIVRRSGGNASVVRTVALKGNPAGAVLTHDGKLLIVAAGPMVAFLDAGRLVSGEGDAVLGYLDAGEPVGNIYANVTADDQFLFVSAEAAGAIMVVNLAKARASGFTPASVVGLIRTGRAPIALTFSADGKYLFTTSQAALPDWRWPIECKPEAQDRTTSTPDHSKGAILIIDVARAKTQPDSAIVARVAAGCNPVRLVTSPNGDVAYVSARGDFALLAFDTKKLLADSAHALIGRVPVGTAPVGVAVIDAGKNVVVTNSNRFGGGPNDTQPLSVIDAAKVSTGAAAVLGTIPAGAFPRELRVSADGRTLFVTNFNSKTLELVDLSRLPLSKP